MHQFEESMYTIEDLIAIPGDAKAELIDGEIHMMAPAVAKHSESACKLAAELTFYFRNKRKKSPTDSWRILTEAWVIYDEHNSFVHDIAGFSRLELPQLPDLGPIHILAKWVCEVLSRSNSTNDLKKKKDVLESYGVPYYWLTDPRRKTIQVFELKKQKYELIHSVGPEDKIVKLQPFEDLELNLQEIFEA